MAILTPQQGGPCPTQGMAASNCILLKVSAGRLSGRDVSRGGSLLDHGVGLQRNCVLGAAPGEVGTGGKRWVECFAVENGNGRNLGGLRWNRTVSVSRGKNYDCADGHFLSSSGRYRLSVGFVVGNCSVRDCNVPGRGGQLAMACRSYAGSCVGTFSADEVKRAMLLGELALGSSGLWGRKLHISWSTPPISRVERTRRVDSVQVRAGYQDSGERGGLRMFSHKINLDEYMVTLEKPIGIRFAQTLSGKVYVEALAMNGNAAKSQMIMVGDVLKKTSAVFGDGMWDVSDFGRTMHAIKARSGSVSLVLERSPAPLQLQPVMDSTKEVSFNAGRVAVSTWHPQYMVSAYQPWIGEEECRGGGNVGFSIFSSKFLMPIALKALANVTGGTGWTAFSNDEDSDRDTESKALSGGEAPSEIIASFSDEESEGDLEWSHGNFPLEEYNRALARARYDLTYNHRQGINYSKVTEQIFVGSCIQSEADVQNLAQTAGITAILNLQRNSSFVNWSINADAIERTAREAGLVYVQFPIRDVDSVDLRRKLPLAVGILYRLLRRSHKVYVTCTTGLEHSPACAIGYLHWIQDVALEDAVEFVNNVRPCGVDLPALVWATWDIIAMVEKENHQGPPTHSVQFVWNHGCRDGEEVLLVGEFQGGWNEPIRAVPASGPKYTVDLRLPQGKYLYKFIVGGQWRHSNNLPTESDRWGNVNNVIKIGGEATTKFETPTRGGVKELTSIKVIQRPLTEDERFMLAFGARRMAFAVDPVTFAPKSNVNYATFFHPYDGLAGVFEGSEILYSAIWDTQIDEPNDPSPALAPAPEEGALEDLPEELL